MVYEIRTGVSWRDLPERYRAVADGLHRFRRYALDGVFTHALQQIQAGADAVGDIDWLVQIDSTNVVAAVLGDHTDWTELTELITDSYLEMAPKFLAARVTLPAAIR